jgi:hypothetical protein
MIQVVEQTRDEKVAMYMKRTKRELAEMLVNANEALASRQPSVEFVPTIWSGRLPGIDRGGFVSTGPWAPCG